jgi:hypothetical protein
VWVLRQWPLAPALARAAMIGMALAVAMLLAGYFTTSDPGGGDRQYGLYGADLDAWWASLDGARFASHHAPSLSRGLEGMHYLGAGVLVLLAFALVAALRRPAAAWATLRGHAPLLLAALALALLAFTHRLGFGGRIVAEWPLDDAWLARLSLFRGSGRMLWLADVLLLLVAVTAAFRALPVRSATLLVGALWLLQVADLAAPLATLRANLAADVARARPDDWAQPLVSSFWDEAGPRYRRLAVAPMTHAAPGWVSLGVLAADRGWSINTGQLARAPWPAWRAEHEWLAASLAGGLLDPDTLYVLHDPKLLDLDALDAGAGVGRVDGLWVVAPGWFPLGGCCLAPAAAVDAAAAGFARRGAPAPAAARIAGARIDRAAGLGDDGWAAPRAALAFDAGTARALRIELQVPPAIAATQRIRVLLDGRSLDAGADADGRIALDLPLARAGRLLLRIEAATAWVPRDAGVSDDARALAWRWVDGAVVE